MTITRVVRSELYPSTVCVCVCVCITTCCICVDRSTKLLVQIFTPPASHSEPTQMCVLERNLDLFSILPLNGVKPSKRHLSQTLNPITLHMPTNCSCSWVMLCVSQCMCSFSGVLLNPNILWTCGEHEVREIYINMYRIKWTLWLKYVGVLLNPKCPILYVHVHVESVRSGIMRRRIKWTLWLNMIPNLFPPPSLSFPLLLLSYLHDIAREKNLLKVVRSLEVSQGCFECLKVCVLSLRTWIDNYIIWHHTHKYTSS